MNLLHYSIAALKKVYSSQKCYRVYVKWMCLFMYLWESLTWHCSLACGIIWSIDILPRKMGIFRTQGISRSTLSDGIRIYSLPHAQSLMEGSAWGICGFVWQLELLYSTIFNPPRLQSIASSFLFFILHLGLLVCLNSLSLFHTFSPLVRVNS